MNSDTKNYLNSTVTQILTVSSVWTAMGFAVLSIALLLVAVSMNQIWLACFCVALMGVAFNILIPK